MAYKDISRAVRLKKDYDNYVIWLNKDTAARQAAFETVNTPANRVATTRTRGYIVPFNVSGASLVYTPARLISTVQSGRGAALATTVKGIVDEFTFTPAQFAALSSPILFGEGKKYKFAKLTIIQRVQTATTKEASRITGRKYYRHENDAVTASFGRKVVADDYSSVIADIEAKPAFNALFVGSENAAASRYKFVPEGV